MDDAEASRTTPCLSTGDPILEHLLKEMPSSSSSGLFDSDYTSNQIPHENSAYAEFWKNLMMEAESSTTTFAEASASDTAYSPFNLDILMTGSPNVIEQQSASPGTSTPDEFVEHLLREMATSSSSSSSWDLSGSQIGDGDATYDQPIHWHGPTSYDEFWENLQEASKSSTAEASVDTAGDALSLNQDIRSPSLFTPSFSTEAVEEDISNPGSANLDLAAGSTPGLPSEPSALFLTDDERWEATLSRDPRSGPLPILRSVHLHFLQTHMSVPSARAVQRGFCLNGQRSVFPWVPTL